MHHTLYSEFVARSIARARQRTVGHPFHPASGQGAQVSETQMKRVLGFIEGAKQQGAKLELGGHRVGNKGYYIAPTVFSDVKDHMTIWQEEVFGPVMTINKWGGGANPKEDLEDVIRRANDTPYGLAAGVFTRDVTKVCLSCLFCSASSSLHSLAVVVATDGRALSCRAASERVWCFGTATTWYVRRASGMQARAGERGPRVRQAKGADPHRAWLHSTPLLPFFPLPVVW